MKTNILIYDWWCPTQAHNFWQSYNSFGFCKTFPSVLFSQRSCRYFKVGKVQLGGKGDVTMHQCTNQHSVVIEWKYDGSCGVVYLSFQATVNKILSNLTTQARWSSVLKSFFPRLFQTFSNFNYLVNIYCCRKKLSGVLRWAHLQQ